MESTQVVTGPMRLTLGRKFRAVLRDKLVAARLLPLILWYKLVGPPHQLRFSSEINVGILRAFGATIGNNVCLISPIVVHGPMKGYSNLMVQDNCVIGGNSYLDLSGKIIMENGASLGPGVIVMTHNGFNSNRFLETNLEHMCGVSSVTIKRGAGVKAGALVTMGVTVGQDSVTGGNAVVNRDVQARHFVAGVPARVIRKIE